jgi:predicted AlkP superfamily phosphohydrolase/phosphomutase
MSPRPRRLAAAAALVALAGLAGSGAAQSRAVPRAVFLGFDGAAADRTEKLMAEGKLPNLAALAKRGGYSPLATTIPAQSPVAWASMTTGDNPGATGIYDFLRRSRGPDGLFEPSRLAIGLGEPEKREVMSAWVRAVLVLIAGTVGAAAGTGVVMAIWAGPRRAARPKGVFQGTMTGVAALFALVAYAALQWVPEKVPYAKNLRSGEPFWVALDKAGVRCIALEAPLSFPADEMSCGCCLSGLGVPDLTGSWGTFALWTDDPLAPARTETGGLCWYVKRGATQFEVVLEGPPNPLADADAVATARTAAERESAKRELAMDWDRVRRRESESAEELLRTTELTTSRVAVSVSPGVGATLTTSEGVRVPLTVGTWSDLVPVVFRVSPVVKIHGRVRFLLQSAGSARGAGGGPFIPFRLMAAPVQFDPGALPPNAQIASPMKFAADLAGAHGPFETIGWPELTNPVKDDIVADREFLDHMEIVKKGREKRLMAQLARGDWDCLFAMFSEPDRVQHALYRHVDPKSPRHDPALAAEFGGEIDRAYVEMDRLVGEVVKAVPEDTRIVVASDHGFAPFRRGVNLNNFLCSVHMQNRRGDAGPENLFVLRGGKMFSDVNWRETKAYAWGLGGLNLNLAGRETQGCVRPADAEKVLADIETALHALRDKDGTKVVRSVYRGKDIYRGARANEAPDLVVGFEYGYRVSWQCSLGAVDDDVITDNKLRWSGDHCSVDPEIVPGILFASLPFHAGGKPQIVDVAPSILGLFGVKREGAEGRPLFSR